MPPHSQTYDPAKDGLPYKLSRHARTSRFRNIDREARRKVTVPGRVGAHVRLVFSEMARLSVSYDEVEIGSGVRRPTIKQWRRKNKPGLESLEAVLACLGYQFLPVPAHVEGKRDFPRTLLPAI